MNFSDQQSKYGTLADAGGLTRREKQYLENPPPKLDENRAVELLVDAIRECECFFQFRQPLGTEFYVAKDHALNCLEHGTRVSPRKVRNWIGDCIKCVDVILLVYLRDVLNGAVPKNRTIKERDVYDGYEELSDPEFKKVAARMNAIYQTRNKLEHNHFQVGETRKIKKITSKETTRLYKFVRGYFKEVLGIMVSRYHDQFPTFCIDANDKLRSEDAPSN